MVVDCARRGAPHYWYYIILMPFGEIAYFFAVKSQDYHGGIRFRRTKSPKYSLASLEYLAKTTPSVENKSRYAQALYDSGDFKTAANLFAELVSQYPRDKRLLQGQGLSLKELGKQDEAISIFRELLEQDFGYQDYQVAIALAQLLWQRRQLKEATELVEKVVKNSSSLEFVNVLATFYKEQERTSEARALIERSLEDYKHSPAFIKRQNKSWAKRLRSLVGCLPR